MPSPSSGSHSASPTNTAPRSTGSTNGPTPRSASSASKSNSGIGDSPFAPKFNIVSKPNDWSRSVQEQAAKATELTETKQLQLRFWIAFRQHMEDKGSFIRCQKPLAQHWTNHALGRSGVHLSSIMSTWDWETSSADPEIRAEVNLNGPNAKQQFAELFAKKDFIESALGFPLTWRNLDNTANCRIFARLKADVTDSTRWPEQFEWLRQKLEALHRVFAPLVRVLTP